MAVSGLGVTSPKPVFHDALFSPKQRNGVPAVPPTPDAPRPPVKAATTKSRLNEERTVQGPELVSAGTSPIGSMSPLYNAAVNASYFEQCFDNLGELGRGSFGVVYKARCRETGVIYAVKMSTKRYKGARDRLRRLAEVKTGGAIANSRHCLIYFGGWEENDVLFLQTEFCKFGSLRDFTYATTSVREPQVWSFLADAAQGLCDIHAHNMLHLDIKPANLFLDDSLVLKIGDFGIASMEENGDREEGDPVYMAPELLNDDFGRPADIFSLGVSMLDVLCGRELPGSGPGWQALRAGNIPVELLAGLSPDMCALLQAMMHPDPARRPSAPALLGHPRIAGLKHRRAVLSTLAAPFRALAALWVLFVGWLSLVLGLSGGAVSPVPPHATPVRDGRLSPPPPTPSAPRPVRVNSDLNLERRPVTPPPPPSTYGSSGAGNSLPSMLQRPAPSSDRYFRPASGLPSSPLSSPLSSPNLARGLLRRRFVPM